MIIRVRNMQPVGGAALPIGQYSVEPGWTSPPLDVEEGTPLDEIINIWVEDGIAMVLPSEDEGGIIGAVHKKRKTSILNLDQAKRASRKRGDMRRTSLDVASILDAPKVPRRASGNSTIRKAKILSVEDLRGKTRTEMGYNPKAAVPAMDKVASSELKDIPGEASMMPPAPAKPVQPPDVKEEAEEAVNAEIEEEVPADIPNPPAGGPSESDEEDLSLKEEQEAIDREYNLKLMTAALSEPSRKVLVAAVGRLEKMNKGLDLEIKAAMLKADVVDALAHYFVANGVDADGAKIFLNA